MTENSRLCEILLKEATDHGPESENPLKFIGVTFEKGKVAAVKTYCKGDGADEFGFYQTGEGKAVSDNIITKDLSGEELNDRVKDYVSGAFCDAPVSVAKISKLTEVVTAEIAEDLKATGGTLYDIGKLRDEAGNVEMIKYYIAFTGENGKKNPGESLKGSGCTTDKADAAAPAKAGEYLKGKDACTVQELAQRGYNPTMLGINRKTDGQRETKLYLDLGKTNSVDETCLLKTKEAVRILGLEAELSAEDIDILSGERLYLRGIGLSFEHPERIRIYFDVFKIKRLRRQLFY